MSRDRITLDDVRALLSGSTSIRPEAVRGFRERRGWTHEQLADEVWASPLEVAAWEAGTVRVPNEQAAYIRHLAAQDRRRAALIETDVPRCEWAEAHVPGLPELLCMGPYPVDLDLPAQRHLGECPTCRRVLGIASRLRVPGDPALGSRPRWSERTFRDLLVAAGMIGAGGVVVWLLRQEGAGDFAEFAFPALMGVVAYEQAAALAGRFLERWPYLAGMLAAGTGVLAGLLVWMLTGTGEPTPPVLAGCAALALVLGLAAGWRNQLYRPEAEDDEPAISSGSTPQLSPAGAQGPLDARPSSRADAVEASARAAGPG